MARRNPLAYIFGGSAGLVMVFCLLLAVCCLGLTVYGLYIAFSASFVIGLIALIFEPSPLIIALVYLAFNYDIPQHIVDYFNSH